MLAKKIDKVLEAVTQRNQWDAFGRPQTEGDS